jgi:beta-glucosidase
VLFRTNAGDMHYDVVGRLPYSWPREPMQSPLNMNDADYRPLFPYGYGLDYAATDTLPGTLPETDPTTVTGRAVRRLSQ